MIYVFDSSPLIVLFRHYYPDRFPTLWEKFDSMIENKQIISCREVANEITTYGNSDKLSEWAKNNKFVFEKPNIQELHFVKDIFKTAHFQTLLRKKERLQGKPVADPFIIARAKLTNGTLITQERWKQNAAQLPNVCEKYGIPCIDLQEFMEIENWMF